MNIINLKNDKEISIVVKMANEILNECYINMISKEQIDYMLNKFLSFEAIKNNLKNSYVYKIIYNNELPIGFYSYLSAEDHIFLSKLYLIKEERNKGIAKEIIIDLKKYDKPLKLTVNKNNTLAIPFYKKMGFIIETEVITDIGSGFFMDDYILFLK